MEGSSDTPPLHHLPGKSKDRKDLSTCHDSPIGSPPIPYRPIPACQVIKRWLHGNNPEAKLLAALVNVSTSCQRFLYEDHAVLPWMPQTGRPPAASLSLSLFLFFALSVVLGGCSIPTRWTITTTTTKTTPLSRGESAHDPSF